MISEKKYLITYQVAFSVWQHPNMQKNGKIINLIWFNKLPEKRKKGIKWNPKVFWSLDFILADKFMKTDAWGSFPLKVCALFV